MLRQHKRRIVESIEKTMPEEALDYGTTVMVMQVSCKAPGCVPLETAVIIVFPDSSTELVPGLPESQNGGSYKTKILKPMADVTGEDILDALPPAFEGGRRTMEKLGLYARDVMLAQITQLFGEDKDEASVGDRKSMALYLQDCLEQYIQNDCQAPQEGEPFPETPKVKPIALPSKGNIVIRRDELQSSSASTPTTSQNSSSAPATSTGSGIMTGRGPTRHQREIQLSLNNQSSSTISQLFQREHAPGVRQAGCPCCDPENPSNVVDTMMML